MIDEVPHPLDGVPELSAPPRSARRLGAVSRVGLAGLVVAVLLAGCGDDSGTADDAGAVSTTEADQASGSDASAGPADGDTEIPCPAPDDELERFGSALVATSADGGTALCLLVADTVELRQRGLMEVTDLGPFDGMVFAYADTSTGGFWMQNTPMPLSIAWISSTGEVVATADMDPCLDAAAACPTHAPGAAYRWAVEVPQGGLAEVGLDDGAEVDVSDWPVGRD